MEIVEKVKLLLQERFPGADAILEPDLYSKRVIGHLIWSGFEDMEQIDRQGLVIAWLRQQLGEDAKWISTILTYSPNEYRVMSLV